jgi:hypothetical protein
MNFDFQNKYKDYSNIELLKIVKSPGGYQQDAVTAAIQILDGRQVTEEEIQFVKQHFGQIEHDLLAEQKKIASYKNNAVRVLDPLLKHSERIDPARWVHLLWLVFILQYGWNFFTTVKYFLHFPRLEYYYNATALANGLSLLYTFFLSYLLFKQKKWGWILLFAESLFIILFILSQSYIFFKYQQLHRGSTIEFVFPAVVRGAFVMLLLQDAIRERFRIDQKAKVIGVSIAVLLFAALLIYGFLM